MVDSKSLSPTLSESLGAYLPIAMSLLALLVVGTALLSGNAVPQHDEDAYAHLWQILICGQLPVVLFFAIKWLRLSNRKAMQIFGLQAVGLLINFATVYALKLG
jgi:hypothetical protein